MNRTGDNKIAIGTSSLANDASAIGNTAVGTGAMQFSRRSLGNVAVGIRALYLNPSGSHNVAIGDSAGVSNTTGTLNLFAGSGADATAGNLSNASAIGAKATVALSNALVLVSISGINGATATVDVGIGTNTPVLIENNAATTYLQMMSPTTGQAGFISGISATAVRSGILMNADSSMTFMTGGGLLRMTVDNTGFVGVRNINPFSYREYVIVNQDNSLQAISSYLDFTGAANMNLLANSSITIQSNGISWYRIR